jgi:hypothetical protein
MLFAALHISSAVTSRNAKCHRTRSASLIDHISDEMRAVVESEWPELAHKDPAAGALIRLMRPRIVFGMVVPFLPVWSLLCHVLLA